MEHFFVAMQTLAKISRATCKVRSGLDALLKSLFVLLEDGEMSLTLLGLSTDFSRLNLICLRTPTSSSSMLCWIPTDASMNLTFVFCAISFPSKNYKHEYD